MKIFNKIDTTVLLSTLWIVVMINMLKADILSLYIPGAAEELARTAGDTPITTLMLGGAIMMEISIVMIILSRVLKYRVNRWANIIVGIITIAFILGGAAPYPHYIFIGIVETIDNEKSEMAVNYYGKTVRYDFDELDEITMAYAISVHKSQGSEFKAVVLPVVTQHFILLHTFTGLLVPACYDGICYRLRQCRDLHFY